MRGLGNASSCGTITDIGDTEAYDRSKNTAIPASSVQRGVCRVILKNNSVGETLLGWIINILPECNVEVCLDGRADTIVIRLECILPVDAGSAVVLAKSLFDGGFKATSIKYVQNLVTNSFTNNEALLQISDWLIEISEYQEAEAALHKVLRLDPSVTSGNHLKAMCNLAELKTLLGLHDDAICLLEAVIQNDPDPQGEHTASALLRLSRAYTELGEFAEAKRISGLLQRAAEALAPLHAAGGIVSVLAA
jgi:tetratricopeptide (TPR) repeat protein